jgi:hypothetical protein
MAVELLERDQRFRVAVACYREIRDMGWLLNCWREIRCRMPVELLEMEWLLNCWREIRCRMPVELLEMEWLLNCWREIRDLRWLWPATERLEIWDGC